MKKKILTIDAGARSGSGTIVRDAVCFAALTGKPVSLKNIRAKRDKPGLRPQHLKAVQACAEICRAEIGNAQVGSRELVFLPGPSIRGGKYHWDIGTAGSTTMLALSVIPLGLFADRPSVYVLHGGLFQDFAPSALYMKHILMIALNRMGIQVKLEIHRPGYVPSGGGCLQCRVWPAQNPSAPFYMPEAGSLQEIRGIALSSHLLQRKVSQRMRMACEHRLSLNNLQASIEDVYDTKKAPAYREPSVQAGACLAVWAVTDTGCILGSDMAGAPGRPAEEIGQKVAEQLYEDLSSQACVDRYLADQLIPFAALAKGKSMYRIPFITDHVQTRLWLVQELLGAGVELDNQMVRITGAN